MEINKLEEDIALLIFQKADGEDVDNIVQLSGFADYLLHSLMMRASQEDIDYIMEERKRMPPLD